MPYDEHESQLRKLERAAAQASAAANGQLAGGILTQMNGNGGGDNAGSYGANRNGGWRPCRDIKDGTHQRRG